MGVATLTATVTIADTRSATDPNNAARGIIKRLLDMLEQQIGTGNATSGTISYPPNAAEPQSTIAWAYTPPS